MVPKSAPNCRIDGPVFTKWGTNRSALTLACSSSRQPRDSGNKGLGPRCFRRHYQRSLAFPWTVEDTGTTLRKMQAGLSLLDRPDGPGIPFGGNESQRQTSSGDTMILPFLGIRKPGICHGVLQCKPVSAVFPSRLLGSGRLKGHIG